MVTRSPCGASGGCSGGRGNVLAVENCCYVAVCSAVQGASAPSEEAEGRGHIVAAVVLLYLLFYYLDGSYDFNHAKCCLLVILMIYIMNNLSMGRSFTEYSCHCQKFSVGGHL